MVILTTLAITLEQLVSVVTQQVLSECLDVQSTVHWARQLPKCVNDCLLQLELRLLGECGTQVVWLPSHFWL